VLHFATHGLLAGETEMLVASKAEPALILTPPAQASEEDDGLLTASEVAQLKLDADWVVLSACNTAAGVSDTPGAEALSGLARAFFYAGGRALLVSHWAVESEATVRLVTRAFDELKREPGIGRAEAMRRSMLALTAAGGRNAHPATWAPFVVVGEGGR
jgi:CHAT domain-containing protein